MTKQMPRARQILEFWFADAATNPAAREDRLKTWFTLPPGQQQAFDEQIREHFSADVAGALRGELDEWAVAPHGRLALVLLLDQFTRNLHRGRAEAFAGDERALRLVLAGRRTGADLALHPVERMFFYMPLEHAEDAAIQDQSVAAFRELADQASGDLQRFLADIVPFAEQHREIIARFGRFPHRNRALGRPTTAAELEYLGQDAPSFGQ